MSLLQPHNFECDPKRQCQQQPWIGEPQSEFSWGFLHHLEPPSPPMDWHPDPPPYSATTTQQDQQIKGGGLNMKCLYIYILMNLKADLNFNFQYHIHMISYDNVSINGMREKKRKTTFPLRLATKTTSQSVKPVLQANAAESFELLQAVPVEELVQLWVLFGLCPDDQLRKKRYQKQRICQRLCRNNSIGIVWPTTCWDKVVIYYIMII